MTWFLWALCSSLCAAALAESNRIFRLDPQYLNAWRSSFAVGLLALALPYMVWPQDKWFYIVATCDGAVTAVGMIVFLHLALKKSGRVSSMILPLAAIGAYMTWWMLRPLERPELVEHPAQVMIAVVSTAVIFAAIQRVRDNDAGWDSFLYVLPVGLLFGVFDALTKWVMGPGYNLYALGLSYAFIEALACSAIAWIAILPKPTGGRTHKLFEGKMIWGGFWSAFWTALMLLSAVFALSLAPNPAFPGMMMAMTPIWLFLYNTFRRVHDDISVPASLMLITGAIGLLLSTL